MSGLLPRTQLSIRIAPFSMDRGMNYPPPPRIPVTPAISPTISNPLLTQAPTTLQDSQGDSVLKQETNSLQGITSTVLTGGAGTSGITLNSSSSANTQSSMYRFNDAGVNWYQTTITNTGTLPYPVSQFNADGSITNNTYQKAGNEALVGDLNGDGIISDKTTYVRITAEEFNAKRDSLGLVDAPRDEKGQILINSQEALDVAGQKPGDPNPVQSQATVAEASAALAAETPPAAAEAIVAEPVAAAPTPEATVEEAPPTPEVEPEVVTLA